MGSSATLAPSPSQTLSPNTVTLVTGFQHMNWRHTHIQTQKGTFQVCIVKVFAEWWNSFSKANIILIFWDFLVLVLVSGNLASDFRFAERKGKEGQLLSGIPLLFWVQPAMQRCPPKNSDSPSSEQNAYFCLLVAVSGSPWEISCLILCQIPSGTVSMFFHILVC